MDKMLFFFSKSKPLPVIENCLDQNLIYVHLDFPLAWIYLNTHRKKFTGFESLRKLAYFERSTIKTKKLPLEIQ